MVKPPELKRPGPARFLFGGRAALDFVNTVNDRIGPPTRDDLPDFDALTSWAWQVELLNDKQASRLKRAANSDAAAASAAHKTALELREAIYRIFAAIVRGRSPATADLDLLNVWAAAARARQRLAVAKPNFEWSWDSTSIDLEQPAFLVAVAASELLTREDLSRIKQCPAPDGCGWLFYDETKNRSRKWCSMEQCGAAAKARRFGNRSKAPP